MGSVLADSEGFQGYRYSKLAYVWFLGDKAQQKIVINFATDIDFSEVTLYSVTIAIKMPQKYQYVH